MEMFDYMNENTKEQQRVLSNLCHVSNNFYQTGKYLFNKIIVDIHKTITFQNCIIILI